MGDLPVFQKLLYLSIPRKVIGVDINKALLYLLQAFLYDYELLEIPACHHLVLLLPQLLVLGACCR